MKTALKIELESWGTVTTAKAGIGIFGLQAIPTAISMLIFWPILIPQIWGIVQQSNLDEEVLHVIEDSLKAHATPASGVVAEQPAAGIQGKFCAQCGTRLPG